MLRALCFSVALLISTQTYAQYQYIVPTPMQQQERIISFDSNITINKDASMDVIENIVVYADDQKITHGLVRQLLTSHVDSYGIIQNANYDVLGVLVNGLPVPDHVTYGNDAEAIYIGDAHVVIPPGQYTYTLYYHVDNVVMFLKDGDEFYWNVTGNQWNLPIDQASVTVTLPAGANIINQRGYTGNQGAKGSDYTVNQAYPYQVTYTMTRPLQPGDGLTVAVAWQKGIVYQATWGDLIKAQINLSSIGVFVILMATLFYYLIVKALFGKSAPGGTIVPLYAPPENISPALARCIAREGFDDKAIAAIIVSLATKGYLKIDNQSRKFSLMKQTDDTSNLAIEEKIMAQSLFKTSDTIVIDRSNQMLLMQVKSDIKASLDAQYENKYVITNNKYVWIGVMMTVVAFLFAIIAGTPLKFAVLGGVWIVVATVIIGVMLSNVFKSVCAVLDNFSVLGLMITVIFTLFAAGVMASMLFMLFVFRMDLPALLVPALLALLFSLNVIFYYWLKTYTVEGRRVRDQLEGFKLFFTTTERYRIDAATPDEPSLAQLEKYLPYAIALDIENAWSAKFNASLVNAGTLPQDYHTTWYSGNMGWAAAVGVPIMLGGVLSNSFAAASSLTNSASGGGGFSGGGGGGGGGGGW